MTSQERRDVLSRVTRRDGAVFFSDGVGNRWQVFELECADGTPCLIFESNAAVRRIRVYPQNWNELPPEDLATLSWRV